MSSTSRFTALAARLKVDWLPKLQGTVVCIASGPSLTADDVELVRATGLATIVTNTTFRIAPWATVLMGYDEKWWRVHHKEVAASFGGHRVSGMVDCKHFGARSLKVLSFKPFGNSGAAAISLAVLAGSRRVVLLGYDCQHTGGKAHWHGDHPAPLGNAGSVAKWPEKFRQVAAYARRRGCTVVNATRDTALDMFERAPLEEALT